MFKVDLAKFKKVSTDKDHTVMCDEKGHELKILHKALSAKMRKQLEALPHDGESSKETKESVERGVKDSAEGKTVDRGSFKKFADGGQVPNLKESYKKDAKDFKKGFENPTTLAEGFSNLKKAVGYAEGGEVTDIDLARAPAGVPDMVGSPDQAISMADAGVSSPMNGISTAGMQQTSGPSIVPGVPDSGLAAAPPTVPTPPAEQPQPMQAPVQEPSMLGGYDKQQQGLKQEADALAQQAQADQAALKSDLAAKMKIEQDFHDSKSELEQERQAHIEDINANQVNPEKYWDNHSKIGTAIGFILAGFNPAGQPNAAIEFFNKQMDNSIKAQERNLGSKENLLSANLKQFGNLRDATDMTRVMQNDVVVNQLKQAAAKAATPLAKARLLTEAGKLEQQIAPTFMMLNLRRSLATRGNDPEYFRQQVGMLRAMNRTEEAKDLESKYVPGVGISDISVPQATRDTITAKKTLDERAKDFYKWSEKHSGSVDPRVVNEGRTKAAELQSLYRNSINGGVFKKGEQEFIDQIIDSEPTKFFNSLRTLPKLKEVISSNQAQLNTSLKNAGFPESAIEPGEAEIKTLNGKQYEKTTRNGVVGWVPVTRKK